MILRNYNVIFCEVKTSSAIKVLSIQILDHIETLYRRFGYRSQLQRRKLCVCRLSY